MRFLRRLIREYIDEMAYGGLVGSAVNAKSDPGSKKHKKTASVAALEKFHQNPLYLKKATAAFKHFPFDIWVQAISTDLYEEYGEELFGVNDEDNRYDIMGVDDISMYNEEYNFPIDIDKIRSITGGGGCVIFSMVGNLRSNFLPTPWMIIHAMFDSGDYTKLGEISYEIEEYIEDELGLDRLTDILPHMTMGSATTGNMTSEREITHELCVQEVITTNGVQFKKSGDSELDEKLEMLKQKIKSYNLREFIADQIRGKVVVVSIQ